MRSHGKYHMMDKYLKRSKEEKKWGSICNIIPLPGTKPTRLCLLTTLVNILVYLIVHVFVFFCLDAAGVAAHEAASPMAIAPLALLILGTVQLHLPWVVPKALFAECRGPIWLVHEG